MYVRFPLCAVLLAAATAVPHAFQPSNQQQLQPPASAQASKPRALHGRFLHITDLHPDPLYKTGAADDDDSVCHRGSGSSGYFGAASSDCDSPFALVNATFDWIGAHLKDSIDFVIWTGDSARHDNDEEYPRNDKQVTGLNSYAVEKFREVFGTRDGEDGFTVPIVPTFGNNDILPHNVFFPGPNRWSQRYLDIWKPFIPEAQRHGFVTGGWYYREVVPNKLAVFSLNSLYFFDHNSAVDGCADKHEPGYAQFEWLRIQLQFLRDRGMKAILIGHVPPARTENKQSWDETCWQKYTLWMKQYRDVVVGSMWGHMNIDHFMLQDTEELDARLLADHESSDHEIQVQEDVQTRTPLDSEIKIQSSVSYLSDMLQQFQSLPRRPRSMDQTGSKKGEKKKEKQRKKYLSAIGGEHAERYSVSFVCASVVPNYFPSLRIVEYNTSGISIDDILPGQLTDVPAELEDIDNSQLIHEDDPREAGTKPVSEQQRDRVRAWSKFKKPKPPSKSAPHGPAYSAQSLTLVSWKQLFANLTSINDAWELARHSDSTKAKDVFKFELEYDTSSDKVYQLPDLTVRNMLELAQRLGHYKPSDEDLPDLSTAMALEQDQSISAPESNLAGSSKSKKKKKKKGKKKKEKREKRNRPWRTFLDRAFVGAKDVEDVLRKMAGRSTVQSQSTTSVSSDEL